MSKNLTGTVSDEIAIPIQATSKINTANLLDQLMSLADSNMKGDGQYTDKQINNQAKLISVAIRVVELEIKINKSFTPIKH